MSADAAPFLVREPVRHWSVGFLLDGDADKVLLIEKHRPAWQAGRLNGVGGKVEPGESPVEAMVREFREETGRSHRAWRRIVELWWEHDDDVTGPFRGCVHFFRGFTSSAELRRCTPGVTDEPTSIWQVSMLADPVIRPPVLPNLLWLVPLAAHRADTYEPIRVVEQATTLRKVGRDGVRP